MEAGGGGGGRVGVHGHDRQLVIVTAAEGEEPPI
jgi:hypothetical protein